MRTRGCGRVTVGLGSDLELERLDPHKADTKPLPVKQEQSLAVGAPLDEATEFITTSRDVEKHIFDGPKDCRITFL